MRPPQMTTDGYERRTRYTPINFDEDLTAQFKALVAAVKATGVPATNSTVLSALLAEVPVGAIVRRLAAQRSHAA